MKKMLQVVHMLQLLKHVSLSSTKSKTPSTPTVTEQPIRWAVKTVCVLTLATVTRPRTPWFYGTELRWNFDTSTEVLDWYFFSDVLQALQATVFWEQGSVSEEAQDLGKITRSSYGGGLRLVGGSGNTYRFEISTGEEGAEMIVMFQYPWRGEM